MAEYPKIVAHVDGDPTTVVVQINETHGFVANLEEEIRYSEALLGSIGARGYWVGFEGNAADAERAVAIPAETPLVSSSQEKSPS